MINRSSCAASTRLSWLVTFPSFFSFCSIRLLGSVLHLFSVRFIPSSHLHTRWRGGKNGELYQLGKLNHADNEWLHGLHHLSVFSFFICSIVFTVQFSFVCTHVAGRKLAGTAREKMWLCNASNREHSNDFSLMEIEFFQISYYHQRITRLLMGLQQPV